ncbi:MAG: hypothetical protein PF441_10035 [Desulfuromusa sp.]|nr:hypothetical protein [Desulfuromusa sp.]
MKMRIATITIASVFAATSLFAATSTYLDSQELGIGEFSDQSSYNACALDNSELGIGENYGRQ